MSLAADNEHELLEFARNIAFCMGAKGIPITADDVQEALFEFTGRQLKNGAGSLFRKGKDWEFVEFKQSRRTSNHGHYYRAWKLKGA